MKKVVKILFLTIILFCSITYVKSVKAASAYISASTTSAYVGDSVTITAGINAAAWNISVSGAVSGSIIGYNEDGVNTSTSKSYTLNTSSTGSYTAYISGDITDENDTTKSVNSSVTIVISERPASNNSNSSGGNSGGSSLSTSSKKPTTTTNETKKSSDSSLRALSITEGTILPEFNKDVFEYTLDLTNEIINATVNVELGSAKANCSIEGNKDLQEGENTISILVTAEDGSTSTYTIKVIKAKPTLELQSLIISIKDENGIITELPLTPEFKGDILEYTLEKISYNISELNIDAIPNVENAEIIIEGNTDLKSGNNVITITLKIPQVVSEETGEIVKEEETKVYTINVEKEEDPIPPTFFQKIGNWFTGVFGGIKNFYNNNTNAIKSYALIGCAALILGFIVYLIFDYKKYQDLVIKIKKVTEMNYVKKEDTIENSSEIIEEQKAEEDNTEKRKPGRHF